MNPRFEFKCSYLDQCEMAVYGHPTVRTVESYSAAQHTLDYYRTIFNHNDDPTSFERNVLRRQGGVCVNGAADGTPHPYRWPQDLYLAFVAHRYAKRAEHEEWDRKKQEQYGADWTPIDPMPAVPCPIYFDHDTTHQWETEPWFTESMTHQPEAIAA